MKLKQILITSLLFAFALSINITNQNPVEVLLLVISGSLLFSGMAYFLFKTMEENKNGIYNPQEIQP